MAPGTPRYAGVALPANRTDSRYVPRMRANAGFLDGHVEAMPWSRLFTDPSVGNPLPKQQPWVGIPRKTTDVTFGPPE